MAPKTLGLLPSAIAAATAALVTTQPEQTRKNMYLAITSLPTYLTTTAKHHTQNTTKHNNTNHHSKAVHSDDAPRDTKRPNKHIDVKHVTEPKSRVKLTLIGVDHTSSASATALNDCLEQRLARTASAAKLVALEAEPAMLQLCSAARHALGGLEPHEVRARGPQLVREAIFHHPLYRERARDAGADVTSAEQVRLHPLLERHLVRDGALWGREQAEAAEAAGRAGVDVICLGEDCERAEDAGGGVLGAASLEAACWLRARVLRPDFDAASCAREDAEAANRALLETDALAHARLVEQPDARMAGRLREVCAGLEAGDGVLVVVGARHVPGLAARLSSTTEVWSSTLRAVEWERPPHPPAADGT